MPTMLVAVIDLGKTNKKVALIDRSLRQIASRSASFPAQPGPDGVLCEQIDAIWVWLGEQLAALYREHPFHALSVTTHGATWAALDGAGGLAFPVIAYEHDLGEAGQAELDAEFYHRCGPLEQLQDETATCDLPLLINPAKMVLFAQRQWPTRFAAAERIVNYPQFWGWKLTGNAASEPTYTFNHSFLHAIRTRQPSRAATALGVAGLLDTTFGLPWDRLGTLTPAVQARLGLPALPVVLGIHDSNAALLPYLVKYAGRDVAVNSTGTWCVAMHHVPEVRYAAGELGTKTIFNIDALGGFQKVSFLMGGQEYALYHELAGGADPGFDPARYAAACTRTGDGVLPGAFPSQFPRPRGGVYTNGNVTSLADLKAGQRPTWFADQVLAHDLLNLSLALQTEVAIRRTGIMAGTTIFIEGGFRNNPAFLALLTALLPANPICCTSLAQATSSGAALLGHAHLAGVAPTALADAIVIEEQPVPGVTVPGLDGYRRAWLGMVG